MDVCVCCTLCRIFVSKMWNIFCLVINVQIFSSSYFWRTLYQCRVCVLWCLLLQSCSVEGFNSKTTLKTSMSDVVPVRRLVYIYDHRRTYAVVGRTAAADQTTLPKAEFFPSFNFLPSVLLRRRGATTLKNVHCHNGGGGGSHFIITRGRLCFPVCWDLQKRHFCARRPL